MEDEVEGTIEGVINNIFNREITKALLISDQDDNDIGFSLYFLNFSTFQIKPGLYIEDLYIDQGFRGQDYGTAVFEYYKQLAKQLGCGRIEWICLDWNQNAIDFYEQKIGATPINGWTVRRITL